MAVLFACEALLLLDPGWTRGRVTLVFGALAIVAAMFAALAAVAHRRVGAR